MNTKKVFLNNFGENHRTLFWDTVIFEFGYPVLFTCVDDSGNLYICVCCERSAKNTQWIISDADPGNVISLLKNEITLKGIFWDYTDYNYLVTRRDGEVQVQYLAKEQIPSALYPKENEYIEADLDEGEFDDEILHFEELSGRTNHTIKDEFTNFLINSDSNIVVVNLPWVYSSDSSKMCYMMPFESVTNSGKLYKMKNLIKSYNQKVGYCDV